MFSSLIVRVRNMRVTTNYRRHEERFAKQFGGPEMSLDVFFASHGHTIHPVGGLAIYVSKRVIIEKGPTVIISPSVLVRNSGRKDQLGTHIPLN
jgi:hypothetical protein